MTANPDGIIAALTLLTASPASLTVQRSRTGRWLLQGGPYPSNATGTGADLPEALLDLADALTARRNPDGAALRALLSATTPVPAP
jgi:hypothetical protein